MPHWLLLALAVAAFALYLRTRHVALTGEAIAASVFYTLLLYLLLTL